MIRRILNRGAFETYFKGRVDIDTYHLVYTNLSDKNNIFVIASFSDTDKFESGIVGVRKSDSIVLILEILYRTIQDIPMFLEFVYKWFIESDFKKCKQIMLKVDAKRQDLISYLESMKLPIVEKTFNFMLEEDDEILDEGSANLFPPDPAIDPVKNGPELGQPDATSEINYESELSGNVTSTGDNGSGDQPR